MGSRPHRWQVLDLKNQLHAAHKIGYRHDRKRRVLERKHRHVPGIVFLTCGRWRHRQGINTARKPYCRQNDQGQHHKLGHPNAPAMGLREHLPPGSAIKAPSEPAAETMPNTEVRKVGETRQEATAMAMAMAEPLHAMAAPMSSPAPKVTPQRPCATQSVFMPVTYKAAPPSSKVGTYAHRQGPGKGLQKTPRQILHRNGQGELRDRYPKVFGQGRH